MKKDLISSAIEIIRENIKLANQYVLEKDFKMYDHVLTVTDDKIDFLLELNLISFDKYSLLRKIVINMI